MKNLVLFLVIVCIVRIGSAQTEKLSRKEVKKQQRIEEYESLKSMVNEGNLEFIADNASTQKGRNVNLSTNPNFLRIIQDSVSADLPFFGRAYSASYGGSDSGIKFTTQADDLQVNFNDKKYSVEISFTANSNNDTHNCVLTIQRYRSASLNVSSTRKAMMKYSGKVNELKE